MFGNSMSHHRWEYIVTYWPDSKFIIFIIFKVTYATLFKHQLRITRLCSQAIRYSWEAVVAFLKAPPSKCIRLWLKSFRSFLTTPVRKIFLFAAWNVSYFFAAVYCGHEYSLQNLKFGNHVEPDNKAIQEKIEWSKGKRLSSEPTVPSTIAEEKLINPFMRVESESVQKFANSKDPIDVMMIIRKIKDSFKWKQKYSITSLSDSKTNSVIAIFCWIK